MDDFSKLTNADILPVDSGALVNSKVETISRLFDAQLQTDENLQNQLALEAVKKLNVDKTVLTYKQQQIDISAEVEAFLTFQRSEKTKNLYSFFLERFFKYLDFVGLDIRTLKAQNVDTWLLAHNTRVTLPDLS